MKRATLILIIALVSTAPHTIWAQRFISSVFITFNTTNDDKDRDSWTRFQLQSADGSWLATNEGTFGGSFPNGSTYTFEMNLGEPDYSDYLLNNTYLSMQFAPVGHDTWNFNWILIVNFSDGTQVRSNGTGGLSQDVRSFRLKVF